MTYKALFAAICPLLSPEVLLAEEQFDILQCFIPCNHNFTGNEIIPSTGCVWYHECWEGEVRARHACGPPFMFNVVQDYCDFPSAVDCPGHIECPGTFSPTTFVEPTSEKPTMVQTPYPTAPYITAPPTSAPYYSSASAQNSQPTSLNAPSPTSKTTQQPTYLPMISVNEPTTWSSQQPIRITTKKSTSSPSQLPAKVAEKSVAPALPSSAGSMPPQTNTNPITPNPKEIPIMTNASPKDTISTNLSLKPVSPSPMTKESPNLIPNNNLIGLEDNAGGAIFAWNQRISKLLTITSVAYIMTL